MADPADKELFAFARFLPGSLELDIDNHDKMVNIPRLVSLDWWSVLAALAAAALVRIGIIAQVGW